MSENIKELTILYVEDEKDVRETFSRLLNKWTSKVYVASNGEEGISLFKEYSPDIVLSDIRMPIKSGMDMAREIRELNKTVPIIFTTAHGENSYLHSAIELNINSYLLKPVSKNKLKEQLELKAKYILFEKKKQRHNEMLQNVIDIDKNMVFATDTKKIHFVNKTTLDFLQIKDYESFYKKTSCICQLFVEKEGYLHDKLLDENECFYDLVIRTDESKRVAILFDYKMYTTRIFYVVVSNICDENNNKLNLYNLTDITEMSNERVEIEHKAYFDKLTDVYNRAKIDEVISYNIKLSQRYKNNFCLILIDIDFFKKFNDTYGHQIGDEVLILLSRALNNAIRRTDVFARWGGEEFVIVLPETNMNEAINVSKYLRKVVEKITHKIAGSVTASFGIAQFDEKDDASLLFQRVDRALYKAKRNGRNRVEIEEFINKPEDKSI